MMGNKKFRGPSHAFNWKFQEVILIENGSKKRNLTFFLTSSNDIYQG